MARFRGTADSRYQTPTGSADDPLEERSPIGRLSAVPPSASTSVPSSIASCCGTKESQWAFFTITAECQVEVRTDGARAGVTALGLIVVRRVDLESEAV